MDPRSIFRSMVDELEKIGVAGKPLGRSIPRHEPDTRKAFADILRMAREPYLTKKKGLFRNKVVSNPPSHEVARVVNAVLRGNISAIRRTEDPDRIMQAGKALGATQGAREGARLDRLVASGKTNKKDAVRRMQAMKDFPKSEFDRAMQRRMRE